MKIVTYEIEDRVKLGIFNTDGTWVYPLASFGVDYKDMSEVLEEMSESEIQFLEYSAKKDPYEVRGAVGAEDVRILAPVRFPKQDIICLGLNYKEHAEESEHYQKDTFCTDSSSAVYFSKRVNRATGPEEEIPSYPELTDSLDYEAELAVILGKDAFQVPKEEAEQYIFGYTIINDVTAREIQTRHKQWYFGKSLDGFLPMGPCIVTANEIGFPPKLKIQSRVNGELRQDSNTSEMIVGVDHVISELSKGMTLKAGTIIAMGTPAGAGMGFTPPKFLKSGDVVECTIEKIGSIKNPVR